MVVRGGGVNRRCRGSQGERREKVDNLAPQCDLALVCQTTGGLERWLITCLSATLCG